jgi:hypothetical protein
MNKIKELWELGLKVQPILFVITSILSIFLLVSSGFAVAGTISYHPQQKEAFRLIKSDEQNVIVSFHSVGQPEPSQVPYYSYLAVPLSGLPECKITSFTCQIWNKDSIIRTSQNDTTTISSAELNRVVTLDDPLMIRDLSVSRLMVKPVIDQGNDKKIFIDLTIEIIPKRDTTNQNNFLPAQNTAVNRIGLEKVLQDLVLNYDASFSFRGIPLLPNKSSSDYPGSISILQYPDKTTWGIITTIQPGFYKFGLAELSQLGTNLADFDINKLQLFLQNQEIPLEIIKSSNGEQNFIFYNSPIDSLYTKTNVYWLILNGKSGKRIPTTNSGLRIADCGLTIAKIRDTIRLEENRVYEETAVTPNAGNDHWFWKVLKVKKPLEIPVPLYGLDTTTSATDSTYNLCTITLNLYGKSEPTGGEDHHVQILLNNQPFAELRWVGKSEKHYSKVIATPQLTVGMNTVTLELPGDTSSQEMDEVYLNYIQVDYPRELKTQNGSLTFRTDQIFTQTTSTNTAIAAITIEPELDNYFVWTIETPGHPVQLSITPSGNQLLIPIEYNTQLKTYIIKSLSAIEPVIPQQYFEQDNLRNTDQQADYLIITHSLFTSIAERLAAYRRKQGLTVRIVNIDDIYTQFSYGIFDPRAIRSFLQYVFYYWKKPAPNYVLLLGDASADYKGNFANGVINYVPSYRKYIVGGECASDQWYAEVSGTDTIPDMLIGRISVNNLTDAETILNKIIRYEQEPEFGSWRNTILFVADDGFEENCRRLEQDYIPDAYVSKEVDLRDYGLEDNFFLPNSVKSKISLECNQVLMSALDQGSLMTIYFGHGSPNVWAHERILFGGDSKNSDMKKLVNGDKLTFVVNLTCSTGGFDYPQKPWNICISEDMHRTKSGGAVALYTPSGLGFTPQHQTMTEYLTKAIFADYQRILGDAVGQSVIEYSFEKKNDLMPEMFILFGDPAMELAVPKSMIAIIATPEIFPANRDNFVLVSNNQKLPFKTGFGELTYTQSMNMHSIPVIVQQAGFKNLISIPSTNTAVSFILQTYLADTVTKLDAVGGVRVAVDSIKLDIDILNNLTKAVGKLPVTIIISNRSAFDLSRVDIFVTVDNDTVITKRNISSLKENSTVKYNLSLPAGIHTILVQGSADNQKFIKQQVIPVNYPDATQPKLLVHPDTIAYKPSPPVSGEVVNVAVPIYNLSGFAHSSVKVSLWNGQTQIDREQTISAISAYSCHTVSFNWNTRGKSGKQEVSVRLNQAIVSATTTELFKPADIAIKSEEISFHKPKYTDGETVFIIATVRNLGDIPAKQVEISGFDGDPRKGGRLLENMASWENLIIPEIPGKGSQVVKLRWDAYNNPGNHELFIYADRNNRVSDSSRENNLASKKVHIRTKPSLDIINKEIIKSQDVKTSRKVTLVATVKNTGETEAENVIIQFYDGEDKDTRIAIGDETIIPMLNAGEEYTTKVDWQVPEEKRKHNVNVEVGTKQSVWKTFESLPPSR